MENENSLSKTIKETHITGLKGILHIQSWGKFSKKPPFLGAITGTVITTVAILSSSKTTYEVLGYLIQLGLSILPNLAGFSLGGYALIIGFGNTELIKSMTKKLSKEKGSLFQKLSAIFAFGLLLQIFSLMTSFLFSIFYNLDLSLFKASISINRMYSVINLLLCVFLLFAYYWTLLVIPYIVTNIFTFGQSYHFYLTVEKIKEDIQEKNKISSNKDTGTETGGGGDEK